MWKHVWLRLVKYKEVAGEQKEVLFLLAMLCLIIYVFFGKTPVLVILPIAAIAFMVYAETSRTEIDTQTQLGLPIKLKESTPIDKKSVEKTKTFADVGGCDEAIEQVRDLVEFLKNPDKFTKLGARMPRGYLFIGPSGTGKTLLACAIAGEADVPFYSEKGTEFVELYVGTGTMRMKELFAKARKDAPAIIFIDEIDAIGRRRANHLHSIGNHEHENTMLQLCAEIDGFEGARSVVLIGATNRPDALDPALVRPGRLDTQIIVDVPDLEGRKKIIEIHLKKAKLLPDMDREGLVEKIARSTPGLVGSDLENLLNRAAVKAGRDSAEFVSEKYFEQEVDNILMGGAELRGRFMPPEEKEIVAYHESGHALVAWLLPDIDPIRKISIIRRGRTLGAVSIIPKTERTLYDKDYFLNNLKVIYGGRAAETLVFSKITSGSEDDLRKATEIARQVICRWGMSEEVGPVYHASDTNSDYLGSATEIRFCSEGTRVKIDNEIKKLLIKSENSAIQVINVDRQKLNLLAKRLIEAETLEGEEVSRILSSSD